LLHVEPLGDAYSKSWGVPIRNLWDRRELEHKRECGYRAELDMETLVCTGGRGFPLVRLALSTLRWQNLAGTARFLRTRLLARAAPSPHSNRNPGPCGLLRPALLRQGPFLGAQWKRLLVQAWMPTMPLDQITLWPLRQTTSLGETPRNVAIYL
jgi:hypothetical protein